MKSTTRGLLVGGLLVVGVLATTAAREGGRELTQKSRSNALHRAVEPPAAAALLVAGGARGTSRLAPEEAIFEVLAAEVLYALPTLGDLQGLTSEEAHFTPEVLLETGARLGEVAVELERTPALQGAGQRFYETCALREDLPSSIRGVCYSHYEGELQVPDEVQAIADNVDLE